jgi:hypothetical protein
MMLLPPARDTCPICATAHSANDPHNNQSLYYQYRFYHARGRWPTWADAIAHCTSQIQAAWKHQLTLRGKWSQPHDNLPIADPPAESFRQAVGDPNSKGFGPEEDLF